jgi:hypothetical protein
MRLGVLCAAMGFVALTPPLMAQEATCHGSASYNVAEMPNPDYVGARFLVTSGDAGCAAGDEGADYAIGAIDEPLWFASIEGDMLVLTRSTGPHGDLLVHDLAGNVRLLDVPADSFEVVSGTLVYWERAGDADRDNCAQFEEYRADGFGAVIAEEKRFAFADGSVTATGRSRCDPTQ